MDGIPYRINIHDNNTIGDPSNTTQIQNNGKPTVRELKAHIEKIGGLHAEFIELHSEDGKLEDSRQIQIQTGDEKEYQIVYNTDKEIELSRYGDIAGTVIDEPELVTNLKIDCYLQDCQRYISKMPNITRLNFSSQKHRYANSYNNILAACYSGIPNWDKTEIDKCHNLLFFENCINIIKIMPALTSLNISENAIASAGDKARKYLADMLSNNIMIKELDVSHNTHEDYGPIFAEQLAAFVKDDNQLEKLRMGDNGLKGEVIGISLGKAIEANTTLKELDLSGDYYSLSSMKCDAEFAKGFAFGLKDNKVLTLLDISGNHLCAAGGKAIAEALTGNQVLASLNISSNWLCRKQPVLADHNGNSADTSGIVAIIEAIHTMGALTSLNISDNNIGAIDNGGWSEHKTKDDKVYYAKEGQDSRWERPEKWGTSQGVIVLTNAFSANEALTSLNISNNKLTSEDIEKIQNKHRGLSIQS